MIFKTLQTNQLSVQFKFYQAHRKQRKIQKMVTNQILDECIYATCAFCDGKM